MKCRLIAGFDCPPRSNITDGAFFLPGSAGSIPATVKGFGAVFTDVDLADITSIEYFNVFGHSLGTFAVPAFPGTGTLSFLGVIFDGDEKISSIRITTGNSALGPNDGQGIDVVAMDDFLYAEPRAVPEPATLTLLGLGLAMGARRWRQRNTT